jgi:hypothetical protein
MPSSPSPNEVSADPRPAASRAGLWTTGLLVAGVALIFAAWTGHVWEDYYITFKSSRNLATGEGLVYHPGERLHTFTSPLGVLLPAAASLLTFNASDAAALWVFRAMSAAALGAAAALLLAFARHRRYGALATFVLLGLFATDAKSVDFSINGMETAWMLLFLIYAMWAGLTRGRDAWKHLGLAWAGLMWTRPDSFVYVAALAAGIWLFNPAASAGRSRRDWIGVFFKAGLLTTALYLPWFLFAWGYYGTPVPHTVSAKGLGGAAGGPLDWVVSLLRFPFSGLAGEQALDSTFLPSYFEMGGWPAWIVVPARLLALGCALLWLSRLAAPEVRALSFTFFCGQWYLAQFPYYPFPWYVPSTTVFAIAVLGGVFQQGDAFLQRLQASAVAGSVRRLRRYLAMAALLLVAAGAALLIAVGRQAGAQQRLVEDGNRRQIGLWLRENAAPGDSVFMEPLGYIGYFSGLKTLDYPGLSSREMVAARRLFNNDFRYLVLWLEPDWLVLRPREADQLIGRHNAILGETYREVRTFSVRDEVSALSIPGRAHLEFDAEFVVFRREKAGRQALGEVVALGPFPAAPVDEPEGPATFLHAPGALVVSVPAEARRVRLRYRFAANAYTDGNATDGAVFQVFYAADGLPATIHQRVLEPLARNEDRGWLTVELDLPSPRPEGASLVLRSDPHGHASYDWTLWARPEFAP